MYTFFHSHFSLEICLRPGSVILQCLHKLKIVLLLPGIHRKNNPHLPSVPLAYFI